MCSLYSLPKKSSLEITMKNGICIEKDPIHGLEGGGRQYEVRVRGGGEDEDNFISSNCTQ